jgi:PAS domain S-box-containing protein
VRERTAALAASEAEARRLAMVADRTSNAVAISDTEGCLTWVNEAFLRISGHSREAVLGRKPGDFLQGPDTDRRETARIREAIAKRAGVRTQLLNYSRDGRPYWVDIDIQPIFGPDGAHTGFIAVNSDITEQREAAERLRALASRQEALLATLPDLILVLDRENRYRAAMGNRAMLVRPAEALIGLGPRDVLPPEPAAKVLGALAAARDGRGVAAIDYALEVAGERREYRARAVRVDDAECMLVVTDITQQRALEGELTAARDAAEAAARAKSAFLANMSHEIRTPMNGVLGLAELLLASRLDAEQADLARSLYRSAEALLTILNDILDFSKIEAGKLEFESSAFDPEQLALDVVELFRARVPESVRLSLRIDPAMPARLLGDPGRIRQMLSNLVGNALKFTSAGQVGIALGWRDGRLEIAVSDSGVGIPADRLARLFQPFTQADASTARRFGGTGLGLSICRRLAELMGGAIGVESQEGRGSTFRIVLPLPEGGAGSGASMAQALAGRRVLVAAAEAGVRAELVAALASAGALTAEAAGVDEAETALAAGAFDAVAADLELPGGGAAGLRCAQPVLALSSAAPGSLEGLPRLAALLVRPLRRAQLAEAVALALSRGPGTRTIKRADLSGGRVSELPAPVAPRRGIRVLLAEDNPVNRKVAVALLARLGAEVGVAMHGGEAIRLADRSLGPLPDGLPDARGGRLPGHRGDPRPRGAQRGRAAADHRHDRQRHGRGSRALPGRRDGRPRAEAGDRRCAGPCAGALGGLTGGRPGRLRDDPPRHHPAACIPTWSSTAPAPTAAPTSTPTTRPSGRWPASPSAATPSAAALASSSARRSRAAYSPATATATGRCACCRSIPVPTTTARATP